MRQQAKATGNPETAKYIVIISNYILLTKQLRSRIKRVNKAVKLYFISLNKVEYLYKDVDLNLDTPTKKKGTGKGKEPNISKIDSDSDEISNSEDNVDSDEDNLLLDNQNAEETRAFMDLLRVEISNIDEDRYVNYSRGLVLG